MIVHSLLKEFLPAGGMVQMYYSCSPDEGGGEKPGLHTPRDEQMMA